MISRRNCLLGASAALICAPSLVRAARLMPLRGVILPPQPNYYGYVDRLWIAHRYRTGQLRGHALHKAVEQGLLGHVPREQFATDFEAWGTAEARTARRQEGIEDLAEPQTMGSGL